MSDKLRNLLRSMDIALTRFEGALAQPANEFVRDSAIQRFEFTFELFWKSLKAYAEESGVEAYSPRDSVRTAFQEVLREVPHLGGNVIHDMHTAIVMREHGIRRIYTRDTDFHRFPFLEVIDPLAMP